MRQRETLERDVPCLAAMTTEPLRISVGSRSGVVEKSRLCSRCLVLKVVADLEGRGSWKESRKASLFIVDGTRPRRLEIFVLSQEEKAELFAVAQVVSVLTNIEGGGECWVTCRLVVVSSSL